MHASLFLLFFSSCAHLSLTCMCHKCILVHIITLYEREERFIRIISGNEGNCQPGNIE
uniref:Uncharacterized protein n=1 Tax=Arundo donax TaxID=35708 RepID=A0A0A8XPN6_ARUDO